MEFLLNIDAIQQRTQYVLNNFEYKEKVKRIGIFGSVARGEAGENSDIDLVLDYIYDENEIEADIITEVKRRINFDQSLRNAFSPVPLSIIDINTLIEQGDYDFKDNIEKDVIWLYGTKQEQKS